MAEDVHEYEIVEVARTRWTRFTLRESTPCRLTVHKIQNTPPKNSKLPNCTIIKMSVSNDPGHFFQSDASESTRARRAAKSGNKNGTPIVLRSKILSVIPDPFSSACIYIAESAGCVRKVNLQVGMVEISGSGENDANNM